MKDIGKIVLSLFIFVNTILLSGCWNYREIDNLAIVAGVAVDRSETDDSYVLTAETVDIKGGKDSKISSKTITMTGDTMFDAVRNMISLSGKKLYFSHARVIILSQDVAREGAVKILDWFDRDAEPRTDMNIMISRERTAKEILEGESKIEQIISFELEKVLKNESSLSKAPQTEIWKFTSDLERSGISAVVPAVELKKGNGKTSPSIMGTAVFKKDKLVGFLNGEETKDLLFIRNKIKGGLLIQDEVVKDEGTKVSLEIFKNTTDLKPIEKDDNVEINVNIKTTVAIDEIQGSENYINDVGRLKLEKNTEEEMKRHIENTIKKVQAEYNSDIFGFGAKVKEDMPGVWKEIEPVWEDEFNYLMVNVNPQIKIKNSALLSKPLEIGD